MIKTSRIDFSRGVNVEAPEGEGYALFIDNADIRNGKLRPIKAPEYKFEPPLETKSIWSYRRKWHYDTQWVDYVGEYVDGIERVYATRKGAYPIKKIGNKTVLLGTPRPKSILSVARTTQLSPGGFKATVSYASIGNLGDGESVYRVSARTKDGIMPPCAPVLVSIVNTKNGNVSNSQASVILSWGQVPGATGYIIWKGDQSEQAYLDEVPLGTTSYTDTGARTASGDFASQYMQSQEFRYAYSYKRRVNGVEDESGLSTLSIPMRGDTGRLITRDPLNDGFYDQPLYSATASNWANTSASITSTGTIASTSAADFLPISLFDSEVTYEFATRMAKVEKNSHGLATGEKVVFTGFSDPAWTSGQYEIIKLDDDNFAIEGLKIPSDGSPLPSGRAVQLVKAKITLLNPEPTPGDVLYVSGSGAGQNVSGFYKASSGGAGIVLIDLLAVQTSGSITITAKWVPSNGYYWKWCIYRNEQGIWNLVEEVDLDKVSYLDAKPYSALGRPPVSLYGVVDFAPPPKGLHGIESHYGMKFGIVGNTVRWTPSGSPDGWPDVYSRTLPYRPVRLASFGSSLIILCEDALYRLDGNDADSMSLSKTYAEDGCSFPLTVQKTDRGLVYLSKNGIMIFDGTRSECITNSKIKGRAFTSPSSIKLGDMTYRFWWMPSVMTKNYADMVGESSIKWDKYESILDNTTTIDGFNDGIRSFYHLGKYYLFYINQAFPLDPYAEVVNYAQNTAFCVDLQTQGFPIITSGFKVLDAHVNEFGDAFILTPVDLEGGGGD